MRAVFLDAVDLGRDVRKAPRPPIWRRMALRHSLVGVGEAGVRLVFKQGSPALQTAMLPSHKGYSDRDEAAAECQLLTLSSA